MPINTTPQLSPQTQAVLDAFSNEPTFNTDGSLNVSGAIAAALRAAADQVDHHWDGAECVDHLVALANELEAQ